MTISSILTVPAADRKAWALAINPLRQTESLPLLIMPSEADLTRLVPQIAEQLAPAIRDGVCRPLVLAGFDSQDWERDFTPWPAATPFRKGRDFSGGGADTLEWLRASLLPALAQLPLAEQLAAERYILGYSLGGLFALWAYLESGLFHGCASCSGSFWYEGWFDYLAATKAYPPGRIYLSLGLAEEKSRNPQMATVGAVTRQAARLFAAAPEIAESCLQQHEGGHFHNIAERISAAIGWLLKTDLATRPQPPAL